jgi:hypothetical protein
MWSFDLSPVPGGRKLSFSENGQPLPYRRVIELWSANAAFRMWFNDVLAQQEYASFRWETPGITNVIAARAFECVVINSPGLAAVPDRHAFSEHFGPDPAVAFWNLRGDAVLVVPCPLIEAGCYGHLAEFVRHAPVAQRHALWRLTGRQMLQRLSDRPVWLSTAGAGVSWLHVRLDDRPKYYSHAPYKTLNFT